MSETQPQAGENPAEAKRARLTSKRAVVADNGKTYTVPDWAPKRVRLDKYGRPELLMSPAIFRGTAEPSSVRGPLPDDSKVKAAKKAATKAKD